MPVIISTREFRDKQKSYPDKIDEGMEVLIQRGKNKTYRVVPVAKDDLLISREELFAKIETALEQHKQGQCRELTPELQKELLGR